MSDILPDLPEGVRMRFWSCPHCPGAAVNWYGKTAICTTCGKTNLHLAKLSDDELKELIDIADKGVKAIKRAAFSISRNFDQEDRHKNMQRFIDELKLRIES